MKKNSITFTLIPQPFGYGVNKITCVLATKSRMGGRGTNTSLKMCVAVKIFLMEPENSVHRTHTRRRIRRSYMNCVGRVPQMESESRSMHREQRSSHKVGLHILFEVISR
ncbi:hypothetical protein TNIN_390071 [Trichonephila inaurata madagascariensis]|uniref:Uncharacterized protein n=1 Tax=Trichonephila inaurata madagascariensis TaxID=2747483 RepID=A0A8X7CF04_9ARAC|nr:hypothetical protein TNIN_390071 [Trichonephila inaurata madagascariensis]